MEVDEDAKAPAAQNQSQHASGGVGGGGNGGGGGGDRPSLAQLRVANAVPRKRSISRPGVNDLILPQVTAVTGPKAPSTTTNAAAAS